MQSLKRDAIKVAINMNDGNIIHLILRPNEDFQTICKKFCEENFLDKASEIFLMEEIKKYLVFQKKKILPDQQNTKNYINFNDSKLRNNDIYEIIDPESDKENNFSFKPKINSKSKTMVKKRKGNMEKTVFQRLFNQVF